jgi:hypothetical protein
LPEISPSRYLVNCGIDDVPHIDAKTRQELWDSTPRHMRDARFKGTPSMGAGAIFPYEREEIECAPFKIPAHFARGYGMDFGWSKTAALFAAWDRDSDVVYLYSEHYRGHAEPSVHADAVKARGEWLQGVGDYAGGSVAGEGKKVLDVYRALGLNLIEAEKSLEAGLLAVDQRLSSGRLKVFSTCNNWFNEQRLYRRDDNGKVVKAHDHLMDCTRYIILKLVEIMHCEPVRKPIVHQPMMADSRGGY